MVDLDRPENALIQLIAIALMRLSKYRNLIRDRADAKQRPMMIFH